MQSDAYWMKRALVLARKGSGSVNPNPMVGAIVVDASGRFVSQGYHHVCGQDHAEKIALTLAGERAKGGTLYLTLEPCSHHGKTPPCLDIVLTSKLAKVVIASKDPNPQVDSIQKIKEAGIQVEMGLLDQVNQKLNRIFFHWIKNQSPYVMAKVAVSRDGFMGHTNKRLLISDAVQTRRTMRLRAMVDGVLVGSHTWKTDDPSLSVRGLAQAYQPKRILLDRKLEILPTAKVFSTKGGLVYLVYDPLEASPADWMHEKNVTCIPIATQDGRFSSTDLLKALSEKAIHSLLIEGGSKVFSWLQSSIHDWTIYQSPDRLLEAEPLDDLIRFGQISQARLSQDNHSQEPPFSLELQSAIRSGRDLVWTSI